MKNSTITPVILAGGSGTRLWPVSRQETPKQFSHFLGDKTLFQRTIERVGARDNFAAPIIVTSAAHEALVTLQLDALGVEPKAIICEPVGRDTAPAIALAAFVVEQLGATEQMLVLPSDHAIENTTAFCNSVLSASEFARKNGALVTFGVKPTRPETGYGYIEAGESYFDSCGRIVTRFIEKPDLEQATRLMANPSVYWNSGMFLFPTAHVLSELAVHAPELLMTVSTAYEEGAWAGRKFMPEAGSFGSAPKLSIDYAVMEHTSMSAIVPASFGWTDLGSWQAVWETSDQDDASNVVQGNVQTEDCKNCLVASDGPLVGVCDLEDVVVIANRDAILVTKRDSNQGLKKLVTDMSQNGASETIRHPGEDRPWGRFDSLDRGDMHQVKRIRVDVGGRLSLQYHHHRAEHWIVVTGHATVTVASDVMLLFPGEQIFIPKGALHRLENLSDGPVEIIEVQYGSYLGEDDIIRVEDVYGRDAGVDVIAA